MNKKFLDLGYQPLANKYLKSFKNLSIKKKELYKLSVGFNTKTKLVSLIKKYQTKKCLIAVILINHLCQKL